MKQEKQFATALDRAKTLYEQVVAKGTEFSMEDDTYRYITAPIADEVHLTQYFRLGYEPADGHPLNDGVTVVLRIDKEAHRKKYDEACRKALAAVEDTSRDKDTISKSESKFGPAVPIDELVKRLPEADEDDES